MCYLIQAHSAAAAAAAAKSLQSCPTLCDPIDGSPPGSPVPGILQARTLEWGAITFSAPYCKASQLIVSLGVEARNIDFMQKASRQRR